MLLDRNRLYLNQHLPGLATVKVKLTSKDVLDALAASASSMAAILCQVWSTASASLVEQRQAGTLSEPELERLDKNRVASAAHLAKLNADPSVICHHCNTGTTTVAWYHNGGDGHQDTCNKCYRLLRCKVEDQQSGDQANLTCSDCGEACATDVSFTGGVSGAEPRCRTCSRDRNRQSKNANSKVFCGDCGSSESKGDWTMSGGGQDGQKPLCTPCAVRRRPKEKASSNGLNARCADCP